MKLSYTILILLISPFYSVLSAQNEDIRLQLERIILHDTEISLDLTPGFIIGIIDRDSTFFFDFGKSSIDSKEKINAHSIFELGSISKLYTAALVNILIKEGLIEEDAPVNNYLAEDFQNPRLDDLTVKDLVSHQSGFPKRPSFFGKKDKAIQNPYAYYAKGDLLEFYKEYIPIQKIGTFRYSHTNYALLEIIIEEVSKMTYEQALKQYIFTPLDLESTFVALPEDSTKITPGHDRSMKVCPSWSFNSFAASEGIKANLLDVLKFTRSFLDEEHPLFEDLSDMKHPIAATDFNEQTYVGKAWHIIKSKKWYNVLTHSGMTSGHHVYISCVPETKTGVVILSNSVIGTEDLSFLILRMINYNWDRKA